MTNSLKMPRQKFVLTAVSFCMGLSLLSCESTKPKETPSKPEANAPAASPDWSAKMQALSQTLSDLLPLVSSRKKFSDPKNDSTIEADTKMLSTLTHSMKNGSQPSDDPSMKIVSGLFEEDISRALEALKTGNRDYARHILGDATSYCIQCHTETNNGPDFPHLNLALNYKDLTALERAELFAATRQFDQALSAYVTALDDPKLSHDDAYEWDSAARSALAITVRVKQTAKDTLKLISALKSGAQIPKTSKSSVQAWEKAAKEWSKEKPKDLSKPQLVLNEAEAILKRAQKAQAFPLDHTQDIAYFRAGSLLHGLLQQSSAQVGQTSDLRASALFWAGVAAESTRDMNFWTLHETYYEQCIRLVPGSEQAKQCFARLKDSVTLGYSGSAGVSIPVEVQKRLELFKSMSDGTKPQ